MHTKTAKPLKSCEAFSARVQVEDWTNHGLQDLQEGVIRTPLAAEQTFLDGVL